jgi:hypothetical protein
MGISSIETDTRVDGEVRGPLSRDLFAFSVIAIIFLPGHVNWIKKVGMYNDADSTFS